LQDDKNHATDDSDELISLVNMENANYKHSQLSEIIIGVFYDVYNELWSGFLESVYRLRLLFDNDRKKAKRHRAGGAL